MLQLFDHCCYFLNFKYMHIYFFKFFTFNFIIVNPDIRTEDSEEITESVSTVTTTSPVDEEQITERTEEPDAITTPETYVTLSTEQLRFEPTTTDYEAEPSDQVVFVTSPRTFAPINFITRKPRIR